MLDGHLDYGKLSLMKRRRRGDEPISPQPQLLYRQGLPRMLGLTTQQFSVRRIGKCNSFGASFYTVIVVDIICEPARTLVAPR